MPDAGFPRRGGSPGDQRTSRPGSHRQHPGSGAAIDARITALNALTTADLQIEWRRLYQAAPPTRLSRDLLVRGVAYKLQERVHGGLSLSIQKGCVL